jgi:hypothetical protein
MAWTLTTLKTAIQDYLETTESTFVAELDNIIINAEQGIVSAVQHPAFRQYANLATVASTSTVDVSSEAPLSIVRMSYWGAPDSITTASTSWLGTNQPDLLLYACLVEAYRFLKGSADLMESYEKKYQEELVKFKLQGEGYDTRDDARNEQHRIPRQ